MSNYVRFAARGMSVTEDSLVEMPHQLRHALLRLLLRHDVDPECSEVRRQLGIKTRVIACVTVNVYTDGHPVVS